MDCFGTYFTHAQSCDNVRVPSATEWTASVHALHMPKAVITFVFQVLLGTCSIFAFLLFRVSAFSRFPVFAFSCLVFAFSRFRVFVFSCFRVWFSRFRVLPPASPGPSHTFRMHSSLALSLDLSGNTKDNHTAEL